ncbi:MAG: hypothetical protein KDI10_05085 [Halioglobus sp.]|nr:hypothetical protein [Halioglobus sp.]MCB1708097.1 hypothetical protein [Halioglobus sp.]MCP5122209.1 hypothetical protein [Pseudomonadales bacterium]MCP5192246.1 hypothetical protein [Pseudomonadales bacterium]
MESDTSRLSTTALARKLNIPAQQLFATLRDYGWIERAGESWLLTPKGEFEGGQYQQSRRYGRYIVWPESLDHHPLLAAIESNQRINAASMCRYYPLLHARQINRALAELGLQHHSIIGWELTERGRALGGLQEESDNSGAFYVTWPHEIVDNPVIHRELTRQSDQGQRVADSADPEPDLFAGGAGAETGVGIDGHKLGSPLEVRVCNWLYLAQLAHAYQRALPTEELVYADFYVPEGNVYIDCWDTGIPARALAGKLHKQELYRILKLRHIEINAADADRLDEVLGRGLLAFGIRC